MLVTQQNTSDKAKLVAKWRKMLEHKKMAPLSNRKKPIVASMLENLYKRSKGLIKEEKLTTADIQTFDTVLIPMIRRIAPELIALDILGTQVMEKPSQLIFALRAFPSGRKGDGCCYALALSATSRLISSFRRRSLWRCLMMAWHMRTLRHRSMRLKERTIRIHLRSVLSHSRRHLRDISRLL